MKVSIIIPFYNNSLTLAWTIRSAMQQTYENLEIILVDDGSTDQGGGSHIALSTCDLIWTNPGFQKRKNKDALVCNPNGTIKLLQKAANVGVTKARNEAVEESTGDLLLFLDGDDWIDSTFLEKTVPLMTNNVGIVSTDMHVFADSSDSVVRAEPATLESIKYQNTIPICSLVRYKAFERAGGFHEDTHEDWNLWIGVLKQEWEHAALNEPLFHYRHHLGESRATKLAKQHEELFENMKKLHPDVYA
jgi:glycosyltransferase involved in cell wall biosynthesis